MLKGLLHKPLSPFLAPLCLLLMPLPAEGSAWVRHPGKGVVLFSNYYGSVEASGTRGVAPAYDVFSETGFLPPLSLIIKGGVEDRREQSRLQDRQYRFQSALRYRIYEAKGWASSLEAGIGYAQTDHQTIAFKDRGTQASTAFSLGHSFQISERNSFWQITMGYHHDARKWHRDQFQIAGTAGIYLAEPLELVGQLLGEVETNTSAQGGSNLKLQLSGTYRMSLTMLFHFGFRQTLAASDTDRVQGGFLGISYHY